MATQLIVGAGFINLTDEETMINASSEASNETSPELFEAVIYVINGVLVVPFSVVANLFTMTAIARNKSMQSPCFYLIFMDSCCAIFLACGHMLDSLDVLLVSVGTWSLLKSRWSCYLLKGVLLISSVPTSSYLALLISVDRLLSVWFPTAYPRFSRQYVMVGAVLAVSHTVLVLLAGLFLGSSIRKVVMCPNVFAILDDRLLPYIIGMNLALVSATVCIYALTLMCFEWRLRRSRSAEGTAVFLTQQRVLMPTVKLLVAIYIVAGAAPEIIVNLVDHCVPCSIYMPRVFVYVGILKEYCSLSSVVALSIASKQFRQYARRIMPFFRCRKSSDDRRIHPRS